MPFDEAGEWVKYSEEDIQRLFGDYKPFAAGGQDVKNI